MLVSFRFLCHSSSVEVREKNRCILLPDQAEASEVHRAISRTARVPQRNPVGRVSILTLASVSSVELRSSGWCGKCFTCWTILKPLKIVIVEVGFIFCQFWKFRLTLAYVLVICVCLVSEEGIGSFGTGLCVGFSHHVGPRNQDLWSRAANVPLVCWAVSPASCLFWDGIAF